MMQVPKLKLTRAQQHVHQRTHNRAKGHRKPTELRRRAETNIENCDTHARGQVKHAGKYELKVQGDGAQESTTKIEAPRDREGRPNRGGALEGDLRAASTSTARDDFKVALAAPPTGTEGEATAYAAAEAATHATAED